MSASERDREFAEKLARSMEENWGRHNSARDFRARFGGVLDFLQVDEQWRSRSRVIGRFGDHHIRECWQACELGDLFTVCNAVNCEGLYLKLRPARPRSMDTVFEASDERPAVIEEWLFERVRISLTPDGGQTWREEEFWLRIE